LEPESWTRTFSDTRITSFHFRHEILALKGLKNKMNVACAAHNIPLLILDFIHILMSNFLLAKIHKQVFLLVTILPPSMCFLADFIHNLPKIKFKA